MNPARGGLDLAAKVEAILADLRDEYTQRHDRPWLVGFSGGKDSTLLLQLVCEMLFALPPSQRRRPVHVVCNDTLVESPVVQAFVDRVLARVGELAAMLPLVIAKTTPDVQQTFWVNLIGRGYRAPTRAFRWCTDRMKIQPTGAYIRRCVAASGEVILLIGVRRAESPARAHSVARYDNGARLNAHNDIRGCLVFRPIVELTTEDVWTTLLQRRTPWGGTHRALVTLYRNAQAGECPFVVDAADAPSCGDSPSSRFGCWTCTVVEKDRSLQGFIDSGLEHLEPLVAFRDWLKALSADPARRMDERRNGDPGLGPFTMATRAEMLDRLRAVESETGLPLIAPREIEAIRAIWDQDASTRIQRQGRALLAVLQNPEDA